MRKTIAMNMFKFRFLLLSTVLCLSAWTLRNLGGIDFLYLRISSHILYGFAGLIFLLAFCLSLSSVLRWAFKRVKLDHFAWDMILTTGFILIFSISVIVFQPKRLPSGSYDLSFDSEVWKSKAGLKFGDDRTTPRQKMLADIVKNVLPGKTKAQIIESLGKPDGTRFEKLADMVYVMGPQRDSYGIDYEWVLIFLEGDKYKEFSLFVD